MLVRHLSFFVTLARERHFARAAEACNVTQPTLSAAIRKLEEDLEARLVIRGHHFVGLTPEGERVLVWGQQILTDYNSLREDLSRLQRGMVGTLRLGVIPAAMPSVSFLTAHFCKEHPAADVEIQSLNSRAIQRGLDAFELDGGITYLENEPLENVRRVPLYHEHYTFVTRPEHPLAKRRTITWSEAAAERLCLLSEDMQNRRIVNHVFAFSGITVTPSVVSNSFLGIYSHLRHGEWSSIVPHTFSYMFGGMRDLVAIELVEPKHSQLIGLVLSNREPPSPMASALLASVTEGDLQFDFSQPLPG
jgi:DNA-binding transcriptional LysR family regulator